MNAVDTNVLARFFVNDADDPEAARQRSAAVAAMTGKVYVPMTVILEFEWVMRGFYALPRKDIQHVLESLAGLENVYIENRGSVLAALNGYQRGLDFADALHLARSEACNVFLSFDKRVKKQMKTVGLSPVVEVPTV